MNGESRKCAVAQKQVADKNKSMNRSDNFARPPNTIPLACVEAYSAKFKWKMIVWALFFQMGPRRPPVEFIIRSASRSIDLSVSHSNSLLSAC